GNIPNLIKRGFMGKIYCTHATKSLVEVILEDSARIQVYDVEYLNEKNCQNLEPIYTPNDVAPVIERLIGKEYGEWFNVTNGVRAYFQDAGHILGSALTTLELNEDVLTKRLGFTGDIGRKFLPILRDPEQIANVNYLITESTYGDHLHDDARTSYKSLANAINNTFIKGGKVIIPSFALERAQELVYIIHELIDTNQIPDNFVYIDSPLAVKISGIFAGYLNLVDKETREIFLSKNKNPFIFTKLRFIESAEDSKKLNSINESCIIISASGMCEFGRIRHHLKNNLGNSKNTVIIVGFMAENTLGRRLLDGERQVNILNERINVKAKIIVLNSLSAHADQKDLIEFIHNAGALEKLFLVHGEEKSLNVLADKIQKEDVDEVIIPDFGEKVDL
ncbi:MBL fold metallo-hydrolase, partial [Candidatus Kuenenbacteria bacterium CG11_big_fil_rev_8_21_14_0_20_37_9]